MSLKDWLQESIDNTLKAVAASPEAITLLIDAAPLVCRPWEQDAQYMDLDSWQRRLVVPGPVAYPRVDRVGHVVRGFSTDCYDANVGLLMRTDGTVKSVYRDASFKTRPEAMAWVDAQL